VTSRRNFSSVRRGAERFRTTGWLAACGGAASRARAKAQLRIGAAAGGANVAISCSQGFHRLFTHMMGTILQARSALDVN
jgi:hypothetical protein